MGLLTTVRREVFYVREMLRLLGTIKTIQSDPTRLTPDVLEASVDAHKNRIAFITESGEEITYSAFDAHANKIAHWGLAQGLEAGDCVALYMGNRWEYIACWYGLSKIGVQAALINNQLTAHSLSHTLAISDARHAIVEGELAGQYQTALEFLETEITPWVTDGVASNMADAQDWNRVVSACSAERPDRSHRADQRTDDTCLKMYTSGTTGLPKAAIMPHTRVLNYLNVFGVCVHAKKQDRMMMVLPLYHATGGLCGVGAALAFGGALIIRRKFSASSFWDDAVEHQATLFMYVGELCRFLVASEPHPLEKKHKIRAAIGNGLRPDVWPRFVDRTGIPRIMEFYGATEGNVALLNLDSKPGAIGRVPPYLSHRFNIKLAQFDTESEEVIRGADGLCVECEPGEVGEAIGEIRLDDARYRFDGYQDEEATKKKILRNVFKEGDAYFRTGDLMKRDKDGYFYFIDRIGDTFRWKSENVSTNEVAEVFGTHEGIVQANVYGVEVADYSGKAGMAALITNGDVDLVSLRAHVHQELPHYARPLFLRLHEEEPAEHTTGTFKLKKTDLVKQGWDLNKVEDPLFFDCAEQGAYIPLTEEITESIMSGARRI